MTTAVRRSGDWSEWRAHGGVVFGAMVGMGTSWALYQYVSSLFLKALEADLGWTRGQISGAFAAGLFGAALAPLTGRIADRYGVRPVLTAGALLVGAGYVLLATVPARLDLLPFLFAFTAAAGTACGAIVYTRAVNSWFDAHRGLALGCTIAGTSVFALFVPLLLGAVIATWGWRAGYLTLAALTVFVGLPVALALVWERREAERRDLAREELERLRAARDRGADGGGAPAVSPVRGLPPEPSGAGATWPEALRMRQYWLLALAMLLVNVSGAGILSQLVPLLTDRGLTFGVAAGLTSLFALCVLVGRVLTGFLVDRVAPLAVAAMLTALPAAGCALLVWGDVTLAVAVAAVVLLGLQQGAEVDLLAFFVARYFGMRTYASIFGSLIMVMAFSTAAGVASWGAVHDATGNYDIALVGSVAAFVLGALCFLALGRVPPRAPAAVPQPAG
jgi:MFS family permease